MRRLLTALVLTGAALPALSAAQDESAPPALYRVTGVETRLNIRAEPSLDAPVIDTFSPGTADIEIVATDPTNAWGRTNTGERSGWVSLAFLTRDGGPWEANALPATLRCFGTEPFWSVSRDGDKLIRGGPDAPDRAFAIDKVSGVAGSGSRVVVAKDEKGTITLGIAPEACTDGMSERAYGLGARLSEGDAPALTGCCSVAP